MGGNIRHALIIIMILNCTNSMIYDMLDLVIFSFFSKKRKRRWVHVPNDTKYSKKKDLGKIDRKCHRKIKHKYHDYKHEPVSFSILSFFYRQRQFQTSWWVSSTLHTWFSYLLSWTRFPNIRCSVMYHSLLWNKQPQWSTVLMRCELLWSTAQMRCKFL